MLNIFKLPSFWLLTIFVCAIIIFDKVKFDFPTVYFMLGLPLIFSGITSLILLFIVKVKVNFIHYIFVSIFLFFAFGLFTLPQSIESRYHIKNYLGLSDKINKIELEITSYPTKFDYFGSKGFSFDAEVVNAYSQDLKLKSSGRLRVYYYNNEGSFSIGDRLFVNKFPEYKPSDFINKGKLNSLNTVMFLNLSPNELLTSIKSNNQLYRLINIVRTYVITFYEDTFSKEVSILAKSMVAGDRSGVTKTLKDKFAITNTSHLLSISGLHLGLIVIGLTSLLKLIGIHRKLRTIILTPFVIFFVFLVGSRAGIIRASFMFLIAMFAYNLLERKRSSLNILFLTGFIILLFKPSSLFDVGYQLSFLSVFAILFFFSPIQKIFQSKISFFKLNMFLKVLISFVLYVPIISFFIQIFTFPVIIIHFGNINFLGVLSNLFLIPVFTIFLYGAFFILVFSFLPNVIIDYLSAFPEFFGRLFLIIIEYFSKLSYNIRLNDDFLYILIIVWMLVIISLSILIMFLSGNASSNQSIKRRNLFVI